MMVTVSEVKKQIEKIRISDFQIEDMEFRGQKIKYSRLLRDALLCFNNICDINDISKEERNVLSEELDIIMKNKLRNLNPDFSEDVLSNMIASYSRGYVKFPMDILVVDDAVFQKEGTFNEFGEIYKIKTFMFEGSDPYYDIYDIFFTYNIDLDNIFAYEDYLTREDAMFTSKFISDYINSIYGKNITKPIYELNKDGFHYGYSGLTSGDVHGVNVYINRIHDDIGKSIIARQDGVIKFCVQDKDNITLYTIHQSFDGDKPIWIVVNENRNVWRLTEAAPKNKNEDKSKLMSKILNKKH